MEEILREVLAADKSILCRRDELIATLENKVPANLRRDFASIKKALALNVGEKFFVGNSDKEATQADVAKILKEGGLQEARVNFVVETFVKALDWDKPITPTLEKKSDTAKSVAFPSVAEVFKKAKAEQKVSTTTPQKTNQQPTPKPTTPQQQSPPKPSTPPQQPTTPPSQKNNQLATTQSTNQKNFFIGVLCFLMLMLFFSAGRGSNPSTLTPNSSTASTQQEKSTPSPPPEDTSYLNARTDLSLNGIDLGIPITEAIKILGTAIKVEKIEGYDLVEGYELLKYIYSDNLEVVVLNEKIIAFVTGNPKFKTKRGLHVGSSYSEVMDAYGTNSIDMQADNLTLREYPFTSLDGKKSLLRFAINSSGRVDYISIRIVEEEIPKKENNSGVDENTQQAALAFLRFHKAISNKDYSVAFNLFTDRRQEEMDYNIRGFAQGYSNTITSEITNLELVSSSNSRVVMNYILDARDRAGGGRTLYQQFSGQVEMVKIGGEWKIAATQSKRIKEVMER